MSFDPFAHCLFIIGPQNSISYPSLPLTDLTVKARMQAGQVEGRSYSSSLDGVMKIIETDGVAGLYRGIGPKLTQSVATVSISSTLKPSRECTRPKSFC